MVYACCVISLRWSNGQIRFPMFTIYPAIDLRGGRVVRLIQGRTENEIVYADDPAEMARHWESHGAAWLHVVNLDGAFGAADSQNAQALKNILATGQVPVQLGGGLRTLDSIKRAFDLGVSRAVLGTVAMEQPQIVAAALAQFGAERIAVGIDARNGKVATRGWVDSAGIDAQAFGKQMRALGVERAIVTDISRDGMLGGIDAGAMADFVRATDLRVIASGGVASLNDVRNLIQVSPIGIEGVIVGQALYTGAFTLRDALRLSPNSSAENQTAIFSRGGRKPRYCEG